jgi:hypothetical protein
MNTMTDKRDLTPAARLTDMLWPALLFAAGFGLFAGGIAGGGVFFARGAAASPLFLVIAACAPIGMIVMAGTYRRYPMLRVGEPDTPRTRRRGIALMALIAFVGTISILPVAFGEESLAPVVFSNDPLPASIALTLGILWMVALPLLSFFARRSADEVHLDRQRFGESIAFQFFGVAAPVWWLGARGGLLPEPDVMILFAATLIVSFIANLLRRA